MMDEKDSWGWLLGKRHYGPRDEYPFGLDPAKLVPTQLCTQESDSVDMIGNSQVDWDFSRPTAEQLGTFSTYLWTRGRPKNCN